MHNKYMLLLAVQQSPALLVLLRTLLQYGSWPRILSRRWRIWRILLLLLALLTDQRPEFALGAMPKRLRRAENLLTDSASGDG